MDQNQLKNQAGVTLNDKWLLPDGGEKGIISNKNSDKYLSIKDNDPGSEVVEEALNPNTLANAHEWQRSADDSSGYFTLKNSKSGRFLTAVTADKVTIEGINSLFNDFFSAQFFNWRVGVFSP